MLLWKTGGIEEIKKVIMVKSPTGSITEIIRKTGVRSMFEDGLDKVLAGITTIEEVLRQTQSER